jgi:hypothetical protein
MVVRFGVPRAAVASLFTTLLLGVGCGGSTTGGGNPGSGGNASGSGGGSSNGGSGAVSGTGGVVTGGTGGGATTCDNVDSELAQFVASNKSCSVDSDCTSVSAPCTPVIDFCDGAVYLSNEYAGPEWEYLTARWSDCHPGLDCAVCRAVAPPPGCIAGLCGPRQFGSECSQDQCVGQFSGHPACMQGMCGSCCSSCFSEWCQCQQDPGCIEMMACAFATGCHNVGCYQPATCQAVIDEWGGPTGSSVSVALSLDQCTEGSGCLGR